MTIGKGKFLDGRNEEEPRMDADGHRSNSMKLEDMNLKGSQGDQSLHIRPFFQRI